jgi:hypothetical protein
VGRRAEITSRARFAAPQARTLDVIEHGVTLASVDEVAALFACDGSSVDDDWVSARGRSLAARPESGASTTTMLGDGEGRRML